MVRFYSVILLLVTFGLNARAATLYVDASAPAGGDGAAWATAFNDLQAGLDAVQSGDEIHVAHGTYKPSRQTNPPNPRSATFYIGGIVRGGYAGLGASNPDSRDFVANETIVSGDLNGDDTPNFGNIADNAYHVINCNGTLDGLTVSGGNYQGNINGIQNYGAGGVQSSGATLTNCTITSNTGDEGAGIAGEMTCINCTFSNNLARAAAGFYGSGLLRGCIFSGNNADYGAGVLVTGGLTVESCIFRGNVASFRQGYVMGAAICVAAFGNSVNCNVNNSLFDANFINGGGGVNLGGGICCYASNGGNVSLTVSNSTFSGNSGGAVGLVGCSPTITNSIFWSNSGGQIVEDANSFASVNYSCVQGGWNGKLAPGTGNISSDPSFVNPLGPDATAGTADDDFHLQPGSPCIDAGSNTAFPANVFTDLAGNRRFDDDPAVPDTGNGTAPIIDIGAYERVFRPWAVPDSATVLHGTTVLISVLSNDVTLNGGVLSINGVTQGAHGTVSIVGDEVSYAANVNFAGVDTFSYTISTGAGQPDSGIVTVTVSDNAPIANAQVVSTHFNTARFAIMEIRDIFVARLAPLVPLLARCHAGAFEKETHAAALSQPVQHALTFLKEHFTEPIGLAETARDVHTSAPHLSRLFRLETGRTLTEHLQGLRVAHARRLLAENSDGVLQIALASGFPTLEHFYRTFRKLTGLAPKAYRQAQWA